MKNLYYCFKKAANIASLDTRENKQKNISLKEMRQIWETELAKVGFSSKEFLVSLASLAELEKNKDRKLTENQNIQKENVTLAIDTVKDATWYLSQYQLKLDYVKIISKAMEFAIGKTTHGDIVYAVNQLIKEGFLISLDKSDTTFVTKELIETEKTIMDFVDNSKNRWSGLVLKDSVSSNIISDEIKKQVFCILQSKHHLGLVESYKIDNKDFIAAVLELAESSGRNVRVLSPNRLLANDINENIARRKPNNIWQWLISLGKPEIGESIAGFKYKYKEELELPSFLLRFKQGKDVVIVDTAEAVNCDDLTSILELTEKSQAKVIFLRDTTNARSFSAGNLMETLKKAGIERFEFKYTGLENTLIISKVIPELKIIKNDNKRVLQLAKEYTKKEAEERQNTIVLVGSKERLKATNEAIRKELKKKERFQV